MRVFALLFALLAVACAVPEEHLLERGDALVTSNGLSVNALTKNALTKNALSANALTKNALTKNGLDTIPALRDVLLDPTQGADAAMLIKYAARCMLLPDQSVTVTYVDSRGRRRTESYPGNLGLQPGWTTAPLSDGDAAWLGSCLAAHVNASGKEVPISVYSPNHAALTRSGPEQIDYSGTEGAFYATYDPTSATPFTFYACYAGDQTDASRDALVKRVCSSTGECGMTVVGQCHAGYGETIIACSDYGFCHPTTCEFTQLIGDATVSCDDEAIGEVILVNLSSAPDGNTTKHRGK